jgi:hypothetical protein
MIGVLVAFNPEAHRVGGGMLLFGVTVPASLPASAFSPIEELDLATHFLESGRGPRMARLLRHIVWRARKGRGAAVDPALESALVSRLSRAAELVRDALRPTTTTRPSNVSLDSIFGTELEGMSPEDRKLEAARRFVRFADAMSRAAMAGGADAPPNIAASQAERLTANRLAPGLARLLAAQATGTGARGLMPLAP